MKLNQSQMQETPIEEFVDDILKVEYLDEMFTGYIQNQEENDGFKLERYKKKFKELIAKSPDQLDKNVVEFINAISEISGQKQKLLFSILEDSVKTNTLSTMIVCQNLLNSPKLQFTNEEFWCSSFNLIMKIIDKADYKEIRDLLKIMLDLIPGISNSFNISLLPQLNAIYQIFEYVFNRDLSLFPAYLVFDEIRKKTQTKSSGIPHWQFSKLITSFVNSFKPVANMCSIAGRTNLLPVFCYRSTLNKVWQLDSQFKINFKGLLPFNEELLKPQIHFLKYALVQPYSKEFTLPILSLKQQRLPVFEDIFIEFIIKTMEEAEAMKTENEINQNNRHWQILSTNVRDFGQLIVFQEILIRITQLLIKRNLKKGRDQLIWLFLQMIPMNFAKVQFSYFIPFIKLIDVLYTEREPLPLPNLNSPSCVQSFTAASIWMFAMTKAETEQINMNRNLPIAFVNYVDFIKQNTNNIKQLNLDNDFILSIIANTAFASNTTNGNESLNKVLNNLIEYVTTVRSTHNQPLPFVFLESLSVQMRIQLTQSFITLISKQITSNKNSTPQPIVVSLLETLFRLFVYSENENPFLKYFILNNLYPAISLHSYVIVHNLLETWTYRTNHTKLNLRFQLITILHNLFLQNLQPQQQNAQPQIPSQQLIPYQLKLCKENALLKLILRLNIGEVLMAINHMQSSEIFSSKESEEYNKILVMVVARAVHITGSERLTSDWCNDLLTTITKSTPLNWSSCTIECFPKYINEFYLNQNQNDTRRQITDQVEDLYKKFNSMSNEQEIIQYFTQPTTPTVFICIIFKSLLEENPINQVSFKVLDKLSIKQFTANIRSFCDYLVFDLAKSNDLSKYIDTLNLLIWEYYILTLDKFLLCLILRPFKGNLEFSICLLIIRDVLLKKNEFRNRMNDFVKEFTPDHWLDDQLQAKQTNFLSKYPEKFYFEFIQDKQFTIFPYYFSNVCLRFLPVLDLIVHRYLDELSDMGSSDNSMNNSMNNSMEIILDQLSPLYKFHDQPITFLYNTLHYYEPKLRNKPQFKKKLVSSVLNSFSEIRAANWALTDKYCAYMNSNSEWNPDIKYYYQLVGRLVDTIKGKQIFPNFDWRFNEFTNAGGHALHMICVELMALPKPGSVVANNLIDIIMIGHKLIPRSELMNWINAIGMLLTALPDEYKTVLNNRIIQMLQSPLILELDKNEEIFRIMNFATSHNSLSELHITNLIALVHSFYHHSFIGQVSLFPEFLNEKVKRLIRTEEQFIFICHIVVPFLDRLVNERTRIACDITILLYEMLEIVDKNVKEFYYMEPICDLLYYIKYSFTGDSVKDEIGKYIEKLRDPLKLRLRFVVHLQVNPPPPQALNQAIKNSLNQINNASMNGTNTSSITNSIANSNSNLNNSINNSNHQLKHSLDQSPNTYYNDSKRLKTN